MATKLPPAFSVLNVAVANALEAVEIVPDSSARIVTIYPVDGDFLFGEVGTVGQAPPGANVALAPQAEPLEIGVRGKRFYIWALVGGTSTNLISEG